MELFNFFLAFLEGVALIVSPCILPVLPIVLSAGVDGGKSRPYGLITGFIVSFWAFTLLSRKLVIFLGLDAELLRQISFYGLLLFGLILLSTFLSEQFARLTQTLADFAQRLSLSKNMATKTSKGFWSGVALGVLIGLIWSPCVGPIIAAVLVQTIRQTTDLNAALLLAAFTIGAGVPMLLITLGGKAVIQKMNFLKAHSVLIRKILGVIIIATVLLTAGSSLFRILPAESADLKPTVSTVPSKRLVNALDNPYPAQNFKGISAWINSRPLTMVQLKGKVVLIDFWTYSCINCVRTLPYVTSWDRKYRDKGLVIIGVHSPEFEFEKKLANVQNAVKQHHIQYPVALDNNLDTFANFNNLYWPAHYLINQNGQVVYTHFGEGEYDTTENNIRALLGITGKTKVETPQKPQGFSSWFGRQTHETYLGYARAKNFKSPEAVTPNKAMVFSYPRTLPADGWALKGNWKVGSEQSIALQKGASLKLNFTAKKVFLVLGTTSGKPLTARIYLNGKLLPANSTGKDVKNGVITISHHTLYELVNQPNAANGLLEIVAGDNVSRHAGLSAYAFTFGG